MMLVVIVAVVLMMMIMGMTDLMLCAPCTILQSVNDQQDAQILIICFHYTVFLSALHVSKESSRSSSRARHDILYYTVQSCRQVQLLATGLACKRVQLLAAGFACTIVPIVLCNTVYYAVLLMMNDYILSKSVEETKNCGIKLIIRIVHLVGH